MGRFALVHPWQWHPHPIAWAVIVAIAATYAVAAAPAASTRQRRTFALGVIALTGATTWPLADLGAHWSVLAHLGSHLLIVYVAPPLLLLGLPEAAVVGLTGPPPLDRLLLGLTHPFTATLLFNGVVVGAHVPAVMDAAVRSRATDAVVHLMLFAAATVMWLTALRLLPGGRRLGYGGRIGFVVLQSLVPNIPAAVLLFSDGPLYRAYGQRSRVLGMAPLLDQQLGGVLVKVVGSGFSAVQRRRCSTAG